MKPLTAFTVDRSKAGGRATICATCDRVRSRAKDDRRRLAALRREVQQLRRRVAKLETLVSELSAARAMRDEDVAAGVVRCRRVARAVAVAARLEARSARYDRVLDLRAHGYGAKRIGRELGVTRDTARDLIVRAERSCGSSEEGSR